MSLGPAATSTNLQPRWSGRRVAIVHDWFQGYHGSERVVDAMVQEVFSGARCDVFTFHAAHELLPERLDAAIVAESRLGRLPYIRQRGHDPGHWRSLLPYMPYYFRSLDLDRYDLVVASSHACAVQAAAATAAPSVCYCYTPMRYAWLPSTDGERAQGAKRVAMKLAGGWLRAIDRSAAARVGHYVAISSAVRERISRFYGRDADVIHPPVETEDLSPHQEKEQGHFLWVHRLVAYKHPEIVAEAFRSLPYRLTMVGVGPLEARLRSRLPPNVELRAWLTREELTQLYERASGFIHVGDEDFGITMVEALAAGVPVIGLARGGARDIVRHQEDGLLIDVPSVEAVRTAVRDLAGRHWEPQELAQRAKSFSRSRFVERFDDLAERACAAVPSRT